jgi:hypothetical protein
VDGVDLPRAGGNALNGCGAHLLLLLSQVLGVAPVLFGP